ncbi:MAG: hypothetical protein HY326_07395 [Chloroflexi bacterium]|nr:hypothetical protein [Chloroflexota bacterium]
MACFWGLAAIPAAAQGGEGPPQAGIVPPQQNVAIGAEFSVTLVVTGVTGLGGYQSDLLYDPAVLEFTRFENGPFLSSAGRSAMPVGPRVEPDRGRVVFGGFGLGEGQPAGGDGVLATLFFRARSAGTSELTLQNTQLVDAKAQAKIPTLQNGKVVVDSIGNALRPPSATSFGTISTMALLTPAPGQGVQENAQPATGGISGTWIVGVGVILAAGILALAWMLRYVIRKEKT